jgi:hypothetical protein
MDLRMLIPMLGDETGPIVVEVTPRYESRHCAGNTDYATCYLLSGSLDVPLLYAYCAPKVFKYEVLQRLGSMNLTHCGVSFVEFLQAEEKTFL